MIDNRTIDDILYERWQNYKIKYPLEYQQQNLVCTKGGHIFKLDLKDINIFTTTIAFNDPLYVAYLTFSTMFGGMFNSTLSANIREKMSLVYNISASLLPEENCDYT